MMDLSRALDEAVKEAGFVSLKTKQEEALKAFISGKDRCAVCREKKGSGHARLTCKHVS